MWIPVGQVADPANRGSGFLLTFGRLRDGATLESATSTIESAMATTTMALIRGLLIDVPAGDPMTFVATALVLAIASLGATYLPARRASRLDPVTALREE